MNGFKIIRVGSTSTSQIVCSAGMIDFKPVLKWTVEKKNAYDPTYIHRRGAYHEDTIKLTAIVTPAQYHSLVTILNQDGALYVQWTSAGSDVMYPVEIQDLPELPDDLNEYTDKTSLSCVSRYSNFNPLIASEVQELTEFDETLIV